MSWRGNPNNPVPNILNEGPNRSDEVKVEKTFPGTANPRSVELRRDNDQQKNITWTIKDIDSTIFNHIESLNLSVIDNGEKIKVPMYYASPEKWKSIKMDGYMRDNNGKIQLPAMVFIRNTIEKDTSMMTFNRYLRYPTMKMYSRKNAYTNFAALNKKIAPTHEVYNMVMPDYMVFTYQFMVWTEYVEQMNSLIERLNFETEDYWGPERGTKFRTKIDSFSHTVELQSNQDRIVKSEFTLVVNGYLLPDSFANQKSTMEKFMTPRRVVINTELVSSVEDVSKLGYASENAEKWRNKKYPNLQKDTFIPNVPVAFDSDLSFAEPTSAAKKAYISSLSNVLDSEYYSKLGDTMDVWHAAPRSSDSPGQEGWIAYDSSYFYVYMGGKWLKTPVAQFDNQ